MSRLPSLLSAALWKVSAMHPQFKSLVEKKKSKGILVLRTTWLEVRCGLCMMLLVMWYVHFEEVTQGSADRSP